MIKTCGHQTIEKTKESVGERLKLGPIKTTVLDEEGKVKEKPPFAGDGYYFWEDNTDAADWWGDVHYIKKHGKDYRVFRMDFTLKYDDKSLFDLIGSRQHIKLLKALIDKTKMALNCENWMLHNYIAYFRLLEEKQKGRFPFKLIRFNDYRLNKKLHYPLLLSQNGNQILVNPFYIICVLDKEALSMDTYTFIKESNNR